MINKAIYLMILAANTAMATTTQSIENHQVTGIENVRDVERFGQVAATVRRQIGTFTAEGEGTVTLGQVETVLTQEGLSQEQIRGILNQFNVENNSTESIPASVCPQ